MWPDGYISCSIFAHIQQKNCPIEPQICQSRFLKKYSFILNFLFNNSLEKIDRQIIVSNQINQKESWRKDRWCALVLKRICCHQGLNLRPRAWWAYQRLVLSVIPLSYPGVLGRTFIKYGPNPASFSNSNAIFTTKKCEKITIWYPVQRFKPMTSRKWISTRNHCTRAPLGKTF